MIRSSLIVLLLLVSQAVHVRADINEDVRWAIGHEGCSVFAPSVAPSALRVPLDDLRACVLQKQSHNQAAATAIRATSDLVFTTAVNEAIAGIERDLPQHLRWVAERSDFVGLVRAGRFSEARPVYGLAQAHNPAVANLLAAVPNSRLETLIDQALQANRPVAERLKANVKWSIDHEGCVVFQVNPDVSADVARSIKTLRECYLGTQTHNAEATALIRGATESELRTATQAATREISDEVVQNFNWVAEHEHQLSAFRRYAYAGRFDGIRAIYATLQQHNPNARHQLAGVSDRRIKELVAALVTRNGIPAADKNPVTGVADERLAIIDLGTMDAEALRSLQLAILEEAPRMAWEPTRATQSGTLRDLVRRRYELSDESVLERVCGAVAETNARGCESIIAWGSVVYLPPLPARPLPDGRFAQFATLTARSTTELTDPRPETMSRGATFLLAGDMRDTKRVFQRLPQRTAVYTGPTYEVAHLITASAPPQDAAGAGAAAADQLQLNTTDRYYVLDFFKYVEQGKQCSHGQQVLDVIKLELKRRGVGHLFQNVIPLELDFFHEQGTHSMLRDYIARQSAPVKEVLTTVLQVFEARDATKIANTEVPLLYLLAVYDRALRDPLTTVISSSFFTESSQFSLLPPTYAATSTPLILTAVADNDVLDVETNLLEPIRTLYATRNTYPVLLVGALLANGKSFGMYSSQGNGVSCVGRGDGWGDASTCIRPSVTGTSFATPGVATTAYLARAWWRFKGLPLTAVQVRDRVLRAVPVVASISGRYASAGIPDPRWLGTSDSAILIKNDGTVHSLTAVSGSVEFRLQGQAPTTLNFGTSAFNIGGLQRADNRWFAYLNSERRWLEITPTSVSLTLPNLANPVDLQTFVTNYKGVIRYD